MNLPLGLPANLGRDWIACQLRQGEARRSTQSISALSASPRLCVSQNDNARDDGRQAGTAARRWWWRWREREGRGTPQEGNLTQRRREAESAEWKIDTREPATFQNVSCRHGPPAWIASQPHAPLNPMNLCALCLSAPLREAKTTKRTDAGFRGGGRRLLHLVPPFGIMRQTDDAARRRRGGHLRNGTSRRGAERQRAQRGRLRR